MSDSPSDLSFYFLKPSPRLYRPLSSWKLCIEFYIIFSMSLIIHSHNTCCWTLTYFTHLFKCIILPQWNLHDCVMAKWRHLGTPCHNAYRSLGYPKGKTYRNKDTFWGILQCNEIGVWVLPGYIKIGTLLYGRHSAMFTSFRCVLATTMQLVNSVKCIYTFFSLAEDFFTVNGFW